jgi:WW domain-containing oxidoreductase
MVSSDAHSGAPKGGIWFDNLDGSKGYSGWWSYGQSKIANLLFAKELARRFAGTQKTANALHPGVIRTNLARNMSPITRAALSFVFGTFGKIALKSVAQGAATEVYVATSPTLANVSGEYFANSNIAKPRSDANDEALAKKLWEVSEKIVAELPQT